MNTRPIDRQACRCYSCRQRDEREFQELAVRLEAMPTQLQRPEYGAVEWELASQIVDRINRYGWTREENTR